MPRKTILITGAAGFLGRSLIPHLRQTWPDARLVGVDCRRERGLIPTQSVDLTRSSEAQVLLRRIRPFLIFHCAGRTAPADRSTFFNVHVRTTTNLLQAVSERSSPYPRIVVIGSAAEYGNVARSRQPIQETGTPHPQTPYAQSKLLQTFVALEYAGRGLPVVVARLFNILGPHQPLHFAPAKFAHWIKCENSSFLRTGPLTTVRDFLSIDDVCRALVCLARKGKPGQIYNVCSGKPVRLKDLLREMAKLAGRTAVVRPITSGSPRTEVAYCVGDPRKIRRDTGWRPHDTLSRTLWQVLEAMR